MPLDGSLIDWAAPDYVPVFRERVDRLRRMRADLTRVPLLKRYYRDHPDQFIEDWGCTFDPRNVERGRPAMTPFLLFPKQREWVHEVVRCWRDREPLITEKTRDCGMSWLAIALACTMCLHYEGFSAGFGSRKEEFVDRIGSPKSLFFKGRFFLRTLPPEFRGGWQFETHAPHMRLIFPDTGSHIDGEAGDGIGRGDRKSMYFVDEAAHLERPELVDASLSMTTNCRVDLSSVNGMGNPFATKRHSGKFRVFTFLWTDDPRKDRAWYDDQCRKLDAFVVAQEIDLDYSAAVEGICIPSAWVRAATRILGLMPDLPTGNAGHAGLDIGGGKALSVLVPRRGVVVGTPEVRREPDTTETAEWAIERSLELGLTSFNFDAPGIGAGVASTLAHSPRLRDSSGRTVLRVAGVNTGVPARDDVEWPDGFTSDQKFTNLKAELWWLVRERCRKTFETVRYLEGDLEKGRMHDPAELISIPADATELIVQLSIPKRFLTEGGKIKIESKDQLRARGVSSPDYADALVLSELPPAGLDWEGMA